MISRNGKILCIAILALSVMAATGCEYKTVFLTDVTHTGEFGGLEGADALCQWNAEWAGLEGTYKAWLSDSVEGPDTRFTHSTQHYVLVDGTLVANDWADLTDGTLVHPINMTASGETPSRIILPWTNTLTSGAPDNALGDPYDDCCNDWDPFQTPTGRVGNASSTVASWTEESSYGLVDCYFDPPLYCFEQ